MPAFESPFFAHAGLAVQPFADSARRIAPRPSGVFPKMRDEGGRRVSENRKVSEWMTIQQISVFGMSTVRLYPAEII